MNQADPIAGTPVPYMPDGDDLILGIVIVCFILAMLAFAVSRNSLFRQLRSFFYVPRREADVTDTAIEVRFQWLLVVQTVFMLGTGMFFYDYMGRGANYNFHPLSLAVFAFALTSLMYFLLKWGLYQCVNWIFFEKKKCVQWQKSWIFLFELEGVLLFPLLMLYIFGSLSLLTTLIGAIIVIILTEILTFYKCFDIFFKGTGVYVQIILYFCALELVPLFALWGAWMLISNYLEIIF